LAEKQYHWILNEAKKNLEMNVELDESIMAVDRKRSNTNQVCLK